MSTSKAHPIAPLGTLFFPQINPFARELLETPSFEFTFNARGALLHAFSEIASSGRGTRVLLPAFHCPSGISPALWAGLEPVFYRINRDLTIDYDDLLAKADSNLSAVLVIHFFGIAPNMAPLEQLLRAGVVLIEDCSHSFLAAKPIRFAGNPGSDYRIYSFWKTVPCGVGGGLLRSSTRATFSKSHSRGKAPLMARLRNFKILMEESIDHSSYQTLRSAMRFFESVRLALMLKRGVRPASSPVGVRGEDHYPLNPQVSSSSIPRHCRRIIEASNFAQIVARRRSNFAQFSSQVSSLCPMQPLVPSLSDDACPWVYPVLLNDRSSIDVVLKAAGVQLHTFGIHLHSALFRGTDLRTVADAQFLANHVLCLQVHQDLTPREIDQAIQVIHREIGTRR